MNARIVIVSVTLLGGLTLMAALSARVPDQPVADTRPDQRYEVDQVHSTCVFRIKHLGVSYFFGRFNNPTGVFAFDPEKLAESSFEITLKTANVDTNSPRRDGHLKSADFFNARQFPDITFKSTSVKKGRGDTLHVTGDLGLHGQTRQITIDLDHVGSRDTRKGQLCGFETTFTIKRSDFGMTYMLDGVGDEVTLMVGLEGVKK